MHNSCQDSKEHAISCAEVTQHLDSDHKEILKSVKYTDIFSSPDGQLQVTRMFKEIIRIRQELNKNTAHHGIIHPWPKQADRQSA